MRKGQLADFARCVLYAPPPTGGNWIASRQTKAKEVIETLKTMKLRTAAALVDSAVNETFTFYAYPPQHWLRIKTGADGVHPTIISL